MRNRLHDVVSRWTDLGGVDPMWAALTSGSRNGRWETDEFLSSGRAEIDSVLALLHRRGVAPAAGTALDFGCGPGRLTAGLAGAGFARVIGVDVSPTMLAKAREIVTDDRCEFVIDTSGELSTVPTGSVDLVYTSRVLQHMPSALAHAYIRQFLRVAAPGAIVVFQLPVEPVGGLVGGALRLLPGWALDRMRHGMQMYGTQPAAVTRVVAEAGGVTVSVEEDASAGPRWRSHLYIARQGVTTRRG